ncbi:MAG: EamA/RhaT family transporter [Burkholderiales bacterium]|nr:EamA/RhaT family transporter [Burkholderiales bacterium]
MAHPDWLWIPITLWAALAQTLRNAAQRGLTARLGTLGATLVRFLYGLPFALLWLWAVLAFTGEALPAPGAGFAAWVALGALAQIAATALLLRAMEERNFALGIAYSKTEIFQVALFAFVALGDRLGVAALLAIACATVGVLLLSPADKDRPLRALLAGWTGRPALLGLASGAGFAFAAVGFRGAALSFEHASYLGAAALTLGAALALQTAVLGGWLLARQPGVVRGVLREWRPSLFAGFMGAAASAGWFTAFAIEAAANVRTLGLVELPFVYLISLKIFRERLSAAELAGMALIAVGIAGITLGR